MNSATLSNIKLHPLSPENLELVRQWRNADHVRLRFEYQKIIDPTTHQNWFRNLDLRTNHYFVIHIKGTPVGVAHIKDIDWEKKEGEAGVFIGETAWLGQAEPALAVVKLMQWAFGQLGLDSLVAKVKADENKVLRFNYQLGYQEMGEASPTGFQRLRCGKEEFKKRVERWKMG